MKIAIVYGLGASASGDGNGLAQLGSKLRTAGHDVKIYGAFASLDNAAWKPDIVIGHSYGGHAAIKYAKKNDHLKFSALVLLDPVVRGWYILGVAMIGQWKISDNVQNALCFYQTSSLIPRSCKIKKMRHPYQNIKVNGLGHTGMCSDKFIHQQVLDYVNRVNEGEQHSWQNTTR